MKIFVTVTNDEDGRKAEMVLDACEEATDAEIIEIIQENICCLWFTWE